MSRSLCARPLRACSKNGKWTWSAGEWFGNEKEAKGLVTSEGMKFYSIASKLPEAFSNKGKDLVVQVRPAFLFAALIR